MFTITFKGKPNPKDKTLVKIEMILFKTKYPRVSKALSIIGRLKDWDEKSQLFSTKAIECLEANNKLSDIRIKYQKVAVNWEAEGKPWSPVQWSHYFDVEQKKKDELSAQQKLMRCFDPTYFKTSSSLSFRFWKQLKASKGSQ